MPMRQKKNWLLCYDIANPRRLGRVHRYMTQVGIPLQYSVFRLEIDDSELDSIIMELEQRIHPDQDDIRIYPLHRKPKSYTIGNAFFPEGIMLFNNENELLG